MRQQVRHAAGTAIFDVVMHGMGIAARRLKGREYRRRHGAAGNHKALAEHEVFKPALFRHHAMPGGVELGHDYFSFGRSVTSVSQRWRRGNWLKSSCPGLAVRLTASLPLAYVPGIHVFKTA